MGKCEVCGAEAATTVCSSTCGAVSYAYCYNCLQQGIEPYDALVGMGLYYADINEAYKQQILLPSLRFHGKTVEQFDDDVLALDEEYRAYIEAYQKLHESCNGKDDFDA